MTPAHGQLFAKGADGVAGGGFVRWVAQEIQRGLATVPSGPVPVDMRFTPPCPKPAKPEPHRIRCSPETPGAGGEVEAAADGPLPRAPFRRALVL